MSLNKLKPAAGENFSSVKEAPAMSLGQAIKSGPVNFQGRKIAAGPGNFNNGGSNRADQAGAILKENEDIILRP